METIARNDRRDGDRPAPAVRLETERRRARRIGTLFGVWTVTGLFLDGWSHIANKPETFFTPWHGVLYSGVGVGMAVLAWEGRRMNREGVRRPWPDAWVRLAGVVFLLSGFGDFLWHQLFGIEVDVDALLSPTHLGLMTAGLLMAASPMRRALTDPSARRLDWSGLVSLTLLVAVIGFFTMFLSPFRPEALEVPAVTPAVAWMSASLVIGGVLFTTLLLVVAAAYALTRWEIPFGGLTLLYGGFAFAMTGLDAFRFAPLALAGLAGGLAADLAVGAVRTRTARLYAAAVAPLVCWSVWAVAARFTTGLPWSAELVGGTIALSTLAGVGIAAVMTTADRQAAAESAI